MRYLLIVLSILSFFCVGKCPDLDILANWMTHDDSCHTTFALDNKDRSHYLSFLLISPSLFLSSSCVGKCPDLDILANWMTHDDSCHTTFTLDSEDRSHYLSGWRPPPPGTSNIPNGYRYYAPEELPGTFYKGNYAYYPGRSL